jgi:3-isopropylmalate dehydrogenase
MMFESVFGLQQEAEKIREVVNLSLANAIVTEDLSGDDKAYKTSEVGDWLAAEILK